MYHGSKRATASALGVSVARLNKLIDGTASNADYGEVADTIESNASLSDLTEAIEFARQAMTLGQWSNIKKRWSNATSKKLRNLVDDILSFGMSEQADIESLSSFWAFWRTGSGKRK